MRIYECYDSPADKRRAQRKGVKRGVASPNAREFLLAFDEDGSVGTGGWNALCCVLAGDPYSLSCTVVSWLYLRENCRSIGWDSLPDEWKQQFANSLDRFLNPAVPELKEQRKRYRKILKRSQVKWENTDVTV